MLLLKTFCRQSAEVATATAKIVELDYMSGIELSSEITA